MHQVSIEGNKIIQENLAISLLLKADDRLINYIFTFFSNFDGPILEEIKVNTFIPLRKIRSKLNDMFR